MLPADILAPLFAQVLLTFALMFWMGARRWSDIKGGRVKAREIALREPGWPEKTRQIANAFSNQFELPVLFYVLTALEMLTGHGDNVFVGLAWAFVVTRYLHALEHTTSNVVQRRGAIYGLGALVLMAAWGAFALRIFTGLP
jgi:hypothetical protein